MIQLKKLYAVLLIVLTVLSIYYSAIFAEILSIDDYKLIENLINKDDFSFRRLFFPGGAYYYRPLLYLTFIADKYIWDVHESFMHLENVLIHAVNASLVYIIAIKIKRKAAGRSTATPLVAALIFALHPIATEPVNWISGRSDLTACLFILCSFYFLLFSLENGSKSVLVLSAISFFLAPLCKETGIFWYPGAMFIIYAVSRNRESSFPVDLFQSLRSHRLYYLAMTSAPVGYFALRYFALKTYDSGIGLAVKGVVKVEHHDVFDKARISLKVFGFYLKKLVFPLPLNFTILNASNWYVIVGIFGIILCLYFCYRRDVLSALFLMSACIISPALLVPLGRMALAPIAERYLYMPAAFFSIAAVVFVADYLHTRGTSPKLTAMLAAAMLVFSGYATYKRNMVWQRNLTLFQDCVDQNPDYVVVRNELATALRNDRKNAEADRLYFSNKLPASDRYSIVTEINRAVTLSKNNDLDGAVALLNSVKCADSNPYYRNYLENLIFLNGRLLDKTDNIRNRNSLKRQNLELMIKYQKLTGDPYGFYNIGKMALELGQTKIAVEHFRLAAEKSPPNAFYKEPARKLAERLGKQLELNN